MNTSKLLLPAFILIFAISATSQNDSTIFFNSINRINEHFDLYNSINEFDFNLTPVKTFNITEAELHEYSIGMDDSIPSFEVAPIIQKRILKELEIALSNKLILRYNLKKLFENNFFIVESPDNKLFNLSFEAKTGGTCRAHVSVLHYRDNNNLNQNNFSSANFSGFKDYHKIDTINTDNGTGYLLFGVSQLWTFSFSNYVDFILFNSSKPEIKFSYSITNRGSDVTYNKKYRNIIVEYSTDDIATNCSCKQNMNSEKKNDDTKETKICKCVFNFDGKSFNLAHESSEIYQEE